MMRCILTCLAMLGLLLTTTTVSAVDYFWTNPSGGAFDEPSNWSPFSPPATQGPGGASDTINFDLGVSSVTPYFVTDMGRESRQLIVHNDSLLLSIFVHHELSSPGGNDPSVIVGASSGDDGFVSLLGGGVSVLDTQVVRIGNVAGSEGSVRIDGLEWNSDNFRVGHAGNGIMSMDSDATLNSTNASIAHLSGSTGDATVLGDWNIDGSFIVGRQGEASLEIGSGGNVSSNSAVIGDFSSSVGQATVRATWNTLGSLTVGDGGEGVLTISGNFGNVSSADAFVGRQPGSSGLVTTSAGIWTINERLSIGGDADAATTGGNAAVEITGGTVTVAQDITIFNNGQVTLGAGSLDAPIINVESGGLFDWTDGNLFVDTFDGSLSNNGGTLAARVGSNSILVSGDYSQGPDGVLSIGIAGDAASNQYDSMIVGNSAFLSGVLHVELAEGFLPDPSETYTILDAVNLIGGSFSNAGNGERLLLNFSGGSFLINYGAESPFDPSQVVLSNFLRSANADFDDDGDVDGDDLEIWQAAYGTTDLGDADGDTDSDGADFLAWQQQLGSPPVVAAVAAVPEPAAAWLALLIACYALCAGRLPACLNAVKARPVRKSVTTGE